MKKTVLTFGLIGGAIMAAMMFATLPFVDQISFDGLTIVGYTTMILAFLLVFFGVRSYRENVSGGQITFGRGFAVGILITLVVCVCYVVAWEIIYFQFIPDFLDKYAGYVVEKVRASGASQQVIDAKVEEMKSFKEMYDNPFIFAALSFIEPFPIGLIVTLISAAFLRKKTIAATREERQPAQLQVQSENQRG
jgi:amino acid transporter